MNHLAKHDHHDQTVGDGNRGRESLYGLYLPCGRGTSVCANLYEEVNHEKAP
jgi:hypothetical protein